MGVEWWRRVPTGRRENLAFRRYVLGRALLDVGLREELVLACGADLLFYVSVFCWTFDPRTAGKYLPFVPWPFQARGMLEMLGCIREGRDLVIEKSRDMGASWMSLVVMEWLWHFHAGHSFLMVSRKEGLVDSPGDPDSLFWKLDFVHRHLPDWLRPLTARRRLHFGNESNGSTIDGESTTGASGVGGRRTALFIDEFSRIEEGYQLLAGTADTTRCRIFNFTPFGTSNAAYRLARRGDVRKLRLHWSEHPEKAAGLYRYSEVLSKVEVLDAGYAYAPGFMFVRDGRLRSPWYDGECRRRDNDREVAQMLDIDYQGSSYQFFSRTTIRELRLRAVPAYWEGEIDYDVETGRPRGLVELRGGPLRLWVHPLPDGRVPVAEAGYAGGCDISSGTGASDSCLSVANRGTGEKVLEYVSPYLRPEQFAVVAVAVGWLFKGADGQPCVLAWEAQGPGATFGRRVIQAGYRAVYYRRNERSVSARVSDEPGWNSNSETKRLLLSAYREALARGQFVNRSDAALEECEYFEEVGDGRIEHRGGGGGGYDPETGRMDPTGAGVNHGDRVIADALAWMLCEQSAASGGVPSGAGVPAGSVAWRRAAGAARERAADGWW